jgi:hypothetical protein
LALFVILCVVGILIDQGKRFYRYIEDGNYTKRPVTMGFLIFGFFFFTVLKALIPTTKEAIFILSAGKTLDYVSSDTSIRKIPGKITDITNEWLDQKLKEMQESVESKVKTDAKEKPQ